MGLRCILALGIGCLLARAETDAGWNLTRSAHFELYSQGHAGTARSTLTWLEQLRDFYLQKAGLPAESLPPIRVIGFESKQEYLPYRIGPVSDAQYVGTAVRDYIVVANIGIDVFPTVAHEYAHSILRAAGLPHQAWFSEGLAEFFSTVKITTAGCTLGGDLPARSQALRRHTWIPLDQLLTISGDSAAQSDRDAAGIFYAESWALADMLVLSPEYGSRLTELMSALTLGSDGRKALETVYGKSLETIGQDLRKWSSNRHPAAALEAIHIGPVEVSSTEEVAPFRSHAILADLLLASGQWDRAADMYRSLARDMPNDPEFPAALGTIALQQRDKAAAREYWKRAIDQGLTDPKLCYQYVVLAENAGFPESDVRPALERALALQPDYDDARYHLALLERNGGHYEAAIAQLRAMRTVAPARAFHYWMAMADSLAQIDRRDEAQSAGKEALKRAGTEAERTYAKQIIYMAQTDFAVQFSKGANGQMELQATRVPHNTTNWNPFVLPSDQMRHIDGSLREIDCANGKTRFVIDTTAGRLRLEIEDPTRVQMRNAPEEFTCGAQKDVQVVVDYAAKAHAKIDGIVRGMTFQ